VQEKIGMKRDCEHQTDGKYPKLLSNHEAAALRVPVYATSVDSISMVPEGPVDEANDQDESTAIPAWSGGLRAVEGENPAVVVWDLSKLKWLGPEGLGLLRQSYVRLSCRGAEVRIILPKIGLETTTAAKIMELCKLEPPNLAAVEMLSSQGEIRSSARGSASMVLAGIKVMLVLLGFYMLLTLANLLGYPASKEGVYAQDAVLALGAMLATVFFGGGATTTGEFSLFKGKYLTLRVTGAVATFLAVLVLLRIYHV
jgi:hypothetical protein